MTLTNLTNLKKLKTHELFRMRDALRLLSPYDTSCQDKITTVNAELDKRHEEGKLI